MPRVPDDLVLPPVPALVEAQRLFDEGLPFHAHEVLEGTWKAAPPEERDLWQGLAQLAVGLTHLRRGNHAGATTLLRRGQRRISAYAERPPYGIDIAGLISWTDDALAELSQSPSGARTSTSRLRDCAADRELSSAAAGQATDSAAAG